MNTDKVDIFNEQQGLDGLLLSIEQRMEIALDKQPKIEIYREMERAVSEARYPDLSGRYCENKGWFEIVFNGTVDKSPDQYDLKPLTLYITCEIDSAQMVKITASTSLMGDCRRLYWNVPVSVIAHWTTRLVDEIYTGLFVNAL